MKRIKYFLLASVAFLGFLFTSCNPTPEGVVSLVVDPSDSILTVEPGQTISWHLTMSPDPVENSTVGQLTITQIRNGESEELETNVYNSESTVEHDFSYTVPDDVEDGEQIQIVFTVTDGLSNNQTSFTVYLEASVQTITYAEINDVQFTYISTNLENEMMIVLTAEGYSMAGGTSTEGQLAFGYNGADHIRNIIASPNAQEIVELFDANDVTYTTDDKQITFIKRINATWEDIDANYIINDLVVDENNTDYIANSQNLGYGASVVLVGELIAFNNPNTGVKGVLKVTYLGRDKSGEKLTTDLRADIKYVVFPNTSAK